MIYETDLARLSAPLPASRVSWRVGSTTSDKTKGMALAYIDARDVMERLDEVCGPGNWQDRYEVHGSKTLCYLSIRLNLRDGANGEFVWVTKADGAGDTDVEAEKGSLSDSFKRAAVKWGIGRYLYDLESPWVEIEPAGRSFKIKKSEYARLERLLGGEAPKAEGRSSVQTRLPDGMEPLPDVGRADALKGYLAIAQTALQNAESDAEIDKWLRDEATSRKKVGLIEGCPHWPEFKTMVTKRRAALSQPEGAAA